MHGLWSIRTPGGFRNTELRCSHCSGEVWQPRTGPPPYSKFGDALDEFCWYCLQCKRWDWDPVERDTAAWAERDADLWAVEVVGLWTEANTDLPTGEDMSSWIDYDTDSPAEEDIELWTDWYDDLGEPEVRWHSDKLWHVLWHIDDFCHPED